MKIFFFPCGIGVRCQKGDRFSLVAIDERGSKRLRSGRSQLKFVWQYLPLLRGIVYFFVGTIALFATFFDAAKIASPARVKKSEPKSNLKNDSILATILLIISLFISIFLFGYLPSRLSFAMIGLSLNFALRNFLIAITKVAIFFLILLILRFIPAMQDLYKFNGACNQVRMRGGSSLKKSKLDYHAPLNILNVLIFTFILSIFVVTFVGISIAWHWNLLINLAIFLMCASVTYEICYFAEKREWSRLMLIVTDFFVSVKPSITHDEIARVAYNEMLSGNGEEVKGKEIAYSSLITEMQTILEKAGKYEKSDVEWIIATVLNKSRAEAKLVKSFSQKEYREIIKATQARASGKPLSSIFGYVEFYGLRFDVNKKVLSPRMETELLVEEAIKLIGNQKLEVLDLGTGSGAIAITIAKFTKAKVTAVDISKGALATAATNAQKNEVKVEFIESDLFNRLKNRKKFDIIISNPPYIRSGDIARLDDEVKNYDPRLALDGGEDGLDFYRKIAAQAPKYLNKGGTLLLEIGQGQFSDVKKLLSENGFTNIQSKKDYSKITRIVQANYDKRR